MLRGLVGMITLIIRKGVFSGRAFYEKKQTCKHGSSLILVAAFTCFYRSKICRRGVSLKTTNEATSISSNKSLEMNGKKTMQIKFIMLIK